MNQYYYYNKKKDSNNYKKPERKDKYKYFLDDKNMTSESCQPEFARETDTLPLGIGYVPWQMWSGNVLNAADGHEEGCIFPELIKPFVCTPCHVKRRRRSNETDESTDR